MHQQRNVVTALDAEGIRHRGREFPVALVAMIGAIVLTHRSRGDVRGQKISKQVDRRPEEAVKLEQPSVGKGMKL